MLRLCAALALADFADVEAGPIFLNIAVTEKAAVSAVDDKLAEHIPNGIFGGLGALRHALARRVVDKDGGAKVATQVGETVAAQLDEQFRAKGLRMDVSEEQGELGGVGGLVVLRCMLTGVDVEKLGLVDKLLERMPAQLSEQLQDSGVDAMAVAKVGEEAEQSWREELRAAFPRSAPLEHAPLSALSNGATTGCAPVALEALYLNVIVADPAKVAKENIPIPDNWFTGWIVGAIAGHVVSDGGTVVTSKLAEQLVGKLQAQLEEQGFCTEVALAESFGPLLSLRVSVLGLDVTKLGVTAQVEEQTPKELTAKLQQQLDAKATATSGLFAQEEWLDASGWRPRLPEFSGPGIELQQLKHGRTVRRVAVDSEASTSI